MSWKEESKWQNKICIFKHALENIGYTNNKYILKHMGRKKKWKMKKIILFSILFYRLKYQYTVC